MTQVFKQKLEKALLGRYILSFDQFTQEEHDSLIVNEEESAGYRFISLLDKVSADGLKLPPALQRFASDETNFMFRGATHVLKDVDVMDVNQSCIDMLLTALRKHPKAAKNIITWHLRGNEVSNLDFSATALSSATKVDFELP